MQYIHTHNQIDSGVDKLVVANESAREDNMALLWVEKLSQPIIVVWGKLPIYVGSQWSVGIVEG